MKKIIALVILLTCIGCTSELNSDLDRLNNPLLLYLAGTVAKNHCEKKSNGENWLKDACCVGCKELPNGKTSCLYCNLYEGWDK